MTHFLIIGFGYLLVAALAALAARRFGKVEASGRVAGREIDGVRARVRAWWLVAALAAAVGLFELLGYEASAAGGFDGALTDVSASARAAERHDQQLIYVAGLVLVALPVTIALVAAFRRAGEAALIALLLAVALAVLAGVRTMGVAEIGRFLGSNLRHMNVDQAIQLAALAGIGIAALSRPSSSWISPKPVSPRRPRYRR